MVTHVAFGYPDADRDQVAEQRLVGRRRKSWHKWPDKPRVTCLHDVALGGSAARTLVELRLGLRPAEHERRKRLLPGVAGVTIRIRHPRFATFCRGAAGGPGEQEDDEPELHQRSVEGVGWQGPAPLGRKPRGSPRWQGSTRHRGRGWRADRSQAVAGAAIAVASKWLARARVNESESSALPASTWWRLARLSGPRRRPVIGQFRGSLCATDPVGRRTAQGP